LVKKGKHILQAGQPAMNLYFIKKGIARGYMKEGNRDITTWITAENEFITSISGFHLQGAAIENIQALEDCELVGLSFNNLEKLYKEFPEYNILVRKFYQHYYLDAEKRALIARLKNAETKYHYFLELHSNLANRVPLKYIASYLGINLETLSRVRKKISKV
jgi:CRP/FNR family transcriptional regulator, anaerobic regulatory protein